MHDIDITTEDTMTLAEACRILPRGRNGAKPHLSTLIRWITVGVAGPDGHPVHLGAVRLGSKWVTTRQAIQRFTAALTPQLSDTAPAPSRTARQRRRASDRAAAELTAAGI